jgi:MbtH protein
MKKYFLPSLIFIIIQLLLATASYSQNSYQVVINHEEQYSVWPEGRQLPRGHKYTGRKGTLDDCMVHIKSVWTDMRPLSIRRMNLPENTIYAVVINHEEQYSVWPANRGTPRGWKNAGMKGTLKECKRYIEEVWTDMRPLSLRR